MPEENALVLLGPEPFEKLRRLLSGLRIDRTGSLGPNRVGEDDHEREDDEAVMEARSSDNLRQFGWNSFGNSIGD